MRLYHRVPPQIRLRMLQEVKRVGKGRAILYFGMTNPWLRLRRAILEKILPGRSSDPYPVTKTQLVEELEEVGLTMRASAWVLPLLADGLLALVTW